MPNSIIQGLTTETTQQLNRLSPFSMTVLLGLLSLVDGERPKQEVRTRPGKLLDIIGIGKTVAHAVERNWVTQTGPMRRKYETKRLNPKTYQEVHTTLLELHQLSVVVRRNTPKGREERIVHLLESFGYEYTRKGRLIDLDDLPGESKINVGSPERPVWRLRGRQADTRKAERPSGILFRISAELADELAGLKDTIRFTLLAHRIFDLLRQFRKDAVAIRLLLLVLRQTKPDFSRQLKPMLVGLGLEARHRTRSEGRLIEALKKLQAAGVVESFLIDQATDRVEIIRTPNRGETAV